MFPVFNRLAKQQQEQDRVEYTVEDAGLNARQLKTAGKALRLLKLQNSLDCLQKEDMMNFLFLVGMNPTPDVLDGKLRLLRLHELGEFTWGQLAHVWSMLLRDAANEEQILERAFQFFDKDGNGEIDVSELRTTMSELGNMLTDEEISAFIAIMDVDGDGVIGYAEFLETLRSEVPEFAKQRTTAEEQMAERHAALSSTGGLLTDGGKSPRIHTYSQIGAGVSGSQTGSVSSLSGPGMATAWSPHAAQRSAAVLGEEYDHDSLTEAAAGTLPSRQYTSQQNLMPAALTSENLHLAQQQQQQQQQRVGSASRHPVPMLPLNAAHHQQQHPAESLRAVREPVLRGSAVDSGHRMDDRADDDDEHGQSLPGQLHSLNENGGWQQLDSERSHTGGTEKKQGDSTHSRPVREATMLEQ